MSATAAKPLTEQKCVPCQGIGKPLSGAKSKALLKQLSGWKTTHSGKRIRKDWLAKDFLAGLSFFAHVAQIAELENHHPDLHLESYRKLWIELWTHELGGLSENDFILAAKIDQLPIELKAAKASSAKKSAKRKTKSARAKQS